MATSTAEIAEFFQDLLRETVRVDHPHEYRVTSAASIYDLTHGKYDYDAPDASVALTVHLGGYSGGNCWGGTAQHYTEDGAYDVSFDILEAFLEACVPDATFRDYRELQGMILSERADHGEYYGNSSENMVYFLPFAQVADFLNARELDVREPELSDVSPSR